MFLKNACLSGENVSLADDQIGAARSKEVTAANQGPPIY